MSSRLTNKEKAFILENCGYLDAEEIAKKLKRKPDVIKNYIYSNILTNQSKVESLEDARAKTELRNRPEFYQLKEELTDEEITYFEHKYPKYYKQFKEDVFETEDTQLFILIKLEILMNRILKEMKRSDVDLEKFQKILDDMVENNKDGGSKEDNAFVTDLAHKISVMRSAQKANYKQYEDLQARHAALLKELKATREQRIRVIENSRDTFIGLIKKMQDKKIRDYENRQEELMKLSVEKERDRISQTHKYMDGTLDIPLLNSETA